MSRNLQSDLATDQTLGRPLPAQIMGATVRSTPLSETDPIQVTIDQLSRTILRGPCIAWAPRNGVLPKPGDLAFISEANDRTLVVVAWMPAS